jgi:hypothetical protein
MAVTGAWDVVASPDFDDDYLRMEVSPYVRLRRVGERVEGEYHIDLQSGSIDGRPEADDRVLFSFEGVDEMDEVSGAGAIALAGERLIFTLTHHNGDDFSFECERRR